jgi:hypothetical protein
VLKRALTSMPRPALDGLVIAAAKTADGALCVQDIHDAFNAVLRRGILQLPVEVSSFCGFVGFEDVFGDAFAPSDSRLNSRPDRPRPRPVSSGMS